MPAPPRVALVVGAPAPDLTGTTTDCDRVFRCLVDPKLGECDSARSRKMPAVETMADAAAALQEILTDWDPRQQFVLYVTGHGVLENDSYAVRFGRDKKKSLWRFPSILDELNARKVTRAVLVLDTCHSGAAHRTKGGPRPAGESNYPTPEKGVCILSACRDLELAHEQKDGLVSVYTRLLCDAIETGLGGEGRDEFLDVAAVNSYISRRLQTAEFAEYRQRPVLSLRNAEGTVWLARNQSYRPPDQRAASASSGSVPVAVPRIVVVADVIDFSFRTPDAQREILERLWATATRHPATAAPGVWLDLFADRLITVFPDLPALPPDRVMNFARDLMVEMRDAGTVLRVAIHLGQVANLAFGPSGGPPGERPESSVSKCYGRGVNEGLRILEVASPGEVIVSEEFSGRLQKVGAECVAHLHPDVAREDNPVHIFGKVEVQQGVRLWAWDGVKMSKSRLLGLLDALDEAIRQHLREMEVELLAGLRETAPSLTAKKLKARVSLLAPQREDSRRMLRSTAFRVATYAKNKPGEMRRLVAPGRTTYSIDGDGTGPPGLAFVKYGILGIFGLPEYAKRPDDYVTTLVKETGMSPKAVHSFGVHARAFLCLPIGLLDTSPDLIVCIDCDHPLNSVDKLSDIALMIAEGMRARHNEPLAALWRVRCSS